MADKETIESSGDGGLTRRDALVKAGVVTAGAVAAGSLAGSVKAAPKRRVAQAPRRGGGLTFALEQDPVHVAPFGAILTSNHWGKQAAYDSLVEWDRNLNLKPALAESWQVAADQKSITFNLRKGVRFHNGKELDAGDVKYSVEKMLNPPLPGSISTVGQVPSFDGVDVVSKYVARLRLKARDARVFGFLAWGRYSPIVPAGLYDQINVSRDAIGTGPYRMLGFDPNDKVEYVRNTRFWKQGLPYMEAMTLKTLPDEQARIAALRAGAIDGATLSTDGANAFRNDNGFTVLKGGTAAFRELQFTIKGDPKPWHDIRVRQAVNLAINRQAIINTRLRRQRQLLRHRPARVRPLAAHAGRAEAEVPEVRPRQGQGADGRGRAVEGLLGQALHVLDAARLPADRVGDQVAAEGDQHRRRDRRPGARHVCREQRHRQLRVGPHRPRHARRRRRLPERVQPESSRSTGPGTRTGRTSRSGACRERQDHPRSGQAAPALQAGQVLLQSELPQIGIIQVNKYQVVRKRVQGMYVAFSDFNTGLRDTVWLSS